MISNTYRKSYRIVQCIYDFPGCTILGPRAKGRFYGQCPPPPRSFHNSTFSIVKSCGNPAVRGQIGPHPLPFVSWYNIGKCLVGHIGIAFWWGRYQRKKIGLPTAVSSPVGFLLPRVWPSKRLYQRSSRLVTQQKRNPLSDKMRMSVVSVRPLFGNSFRGCIWKYVCSRIEYPFSSSRRRPCQGVIYSLSGSRWRQQHDSFGQKNFFPNLVVAVPFQMVKMTFYSSQSIGGIWTKPWSVLLSIKRP